MLTNPYDAMLYRPLYVIGSDDAQPSYCVFSIFIRRHLGFSYFRSFCQKFIFAPICSSSCKIWRSDYLRRVPELLRIFDFQNGGRPPSWMWYDVIANHLRLMFEGLNILLQFMFIVRLRDIVIFISGPFDLPIHAHFGGVLGDMTGFPLELGTVQGVKKLECWGYQKVENCFDIDLAVLTQYRRVTDRQTDRQPYFHSKYRAMLCVARVKKKL